MAWRPTGIGRLVVGLVLLIGCSGESGGTVADGGASSADEPPAGEDAPEAEPSADVDLTPGPDAELTVDPVPQGYTFEGEEPLGSDEDTAILQVFKGPEAAIANPGGPTAQLRVYVSASHVEGFSSSGRIDDLTDQATTPPEDPFGEKVAEDELEINGFPAVELSSPGVPTPGAAARDYEIVMALGDWRVMVSGSSVPSEVLKQFAEGVTLG